jgi:hypothetical protein
MIFQSNSTINKINITKIHSRLFWPLKVNYRKLFIFFLQNIFGRSAIKMQIFNSFSVWAKARLKICWLPAVQAPMSAGDKKNRC